MAKLFLILDFTFSRFEKKPHGLRSSAGQVSIFSTSVSCAASCCHSVRVFGRVNHSCTHRACLSKTLIRIVLRVETSLSHKKRKNEKKIVLLSSLIARARLQLCVCAVRVLCLDIVTDDTSARARRRRTYRPSIIDGAQYVSARFFFFRLYDARFTRPPIKARGAKDGGRGGGRGQREKQVYAVRSKCVPWVARSYCTASKSLHDKKKKKSVY